METTSLDYYGHKKNWWKRKITLYNRKFLATKRKLGLIDSKAYETLHFHSKKSLFTKTTLKHIKVTQTKNGKLLVISFSRRRKSNSEDIYLSKIAQHIPTRNLTNSIPQ